MPTMQITSEWVLRNLMNFGVDAMLAALILIIGWWLSNRLSALLMRSLAKTSADVTIRPILTSIVMWAIRLIALTAALDRFGVRTTSIVAALGAAGLAIGLALQGTLQNIAAGFMILLLRPFRVGDYIEGSGTVAGSVKEISLFYTRLTKPDGQGMFVPNSQLWSSAITNYTVNATRRIDASMVVPHTEVSTAIDKLRSLIEADSRILAEPAPNVVVSDFTDIGTKITVYAWTQNADFLAVKSELLGQVPPELKKTAALAQRV
ncbi:MULTISPECIES: mechanosensitive ion channel family protein [Silvimonas]|uniref:mechanosensitive ion channel family protein n=1 Tax=Silvimonas TaxID=300264 RepID=UPI0024B3B24B|nr:MULTISPECIES: mechanosensitive ion channel family protein [Silvimonas]MDR3428886.1 mechanosensitive ion channel family protein [Silvimonas sp.]